jgi:protein SCO1/2
MNWLFKLFLMTAIYLSLSTTAVANRLSLETSADYGGNFTLQSLQGPVSLEQYRGRVVLLFFGFTSCPDICPTALWDISRVFKQLNADELKQVNALFISLDPERDNYELLQTYAGYFHTRITGVTGRIEIVRQVAERYGVSFDKKAMESSPIGYVINHSPDILIVNRDGQLLKSRITPAHDIDEIVAFVRSLLGAS